MTIDKITKEEFERITENHVTNNNLIKLDIPAVGHKYSFDLNKYEDFPFMLAYEEAGNTYFYIGEQGTIMNFGSLFLFSDKNPYIKNGEGYVLKENDGNNTLLDSDIRILSLYLPEKVKEHFSIVKEEGSEENFQYQAQKFNNY